jgi:plasmid stabilization system protein ParE
MRLIIEAAARRDIDEAAGWYENQERGLGGAFLDAVQAAVGRITATPRIFRLSRANMRAASIRKFPYTIYFTQTEEIVQIVAVLHQRRDPNALDSRLN